MPSVPAVDQAYLAVLSLSLHQGEASAIMSVLPAQAELIQVFMNHEMPLPWLVLFVYDAHISAL